MEITFENLPKAVTNIQETVNDIKRLLLEKGNEPLKNELPDLIKIKEAETETGYKRGYIYELVSKRAIPFHKVGASLRFSRRELREWIIAGRPHLMQQAVDNLSTNYVVNKKGGKHG